jgi:hypothetical protein
MESRRHSPLNGASHTYFENRLTTEGNSPVNLIILFYCITNEIFIYFALWKPKSKNHF